MKSGDAIDVDFGKVGLGATEGVQIGDIVVRAGARKEKLALENIQVQEVAPNPGKAVESTDVSKEQDSRVYTCKFKTRTDNFKDIGNLSLNLRFGLPQTSLHLGV
ncbi:hypothetical protein TSUD_216780 [Trifolium subterraneum]|uniref:Uncharacterized protein n=1 Tax=Trifolium subterraneum TaxID=3900 RepID=A0A2Z6M1R9_TRISU|nr:hypothetical protein TSUD_216780 [Trifolium subterraneum]